MKIAVIGTGMVGRAVASRLAELGHDVVVGTRDVERTLARSGTAWQNAASNTKLVSLPEAGAHADLLVNATHGANSLEALEAVGRPHLAGKVLLDLALPLDLSQGIPPKLLVANDDSLGEQIQRAFPEARVVKSLNTVFYKVMIDPGRVPGRHNIFVAGDDADAKQQVRVLLNGFGWPLDDIIDLGGIQSARSTEMYMQLYFNLVGVLGDSFDFNIAVMRRQDGVGR